MNDNNKNQQFCHKRFARQQHHQSFLSYIVSGDEKRCPYVNIKQIKEWLFCKLFLKRNSVGLYFIIHQIVEIIIWSSLQTNPVFHGLFRIYIF